MKLATSVACVVACAPLVTIGGCNCHATYGTGVTGSGAAMDAGTPSVADSGQAPAATTPAVRLVRREQVHGRCPPEDARSLTGAKGAGATCSEAEECTPVCCACPGSAVTWLAAACVDSACADAVGACSDSPSTGVCDQAHATSASTEHTNFRCSPGIGGRKKIGEACSEGSECAATCCPCDSSRTWSASACVNGACAPRSVTCAVAPMNGDYCGAPPSQTERNSWGEQENGRCPSGPSKLVGSKSAGQPCSAAADCAPACCDCGTSGASWLGSTCLNGRCAPANIACLETEDDARFCGGHCRGAGAPCWRDGACCSKSCDKKKRCR